MKTFIQWLEAGYQTPPVPGVADRFARENPYGKQTMSTQQAEISKQQRQQSLANVLRHLQQTGSPHSDQVKRMIISNSNTSDLGYMQIKGLLGQEFDAALNPGVKTVPPPPPGSTFSQHYNPAVASNTPPPPRTV